MTQYSNDNFVLSGGIRAGSSDAGQTRLKYDIYDLSKLPDDENADPSVAKVGYVELFVDDQTGMIVGLVDIKIEPKFRKDGIGRRVVKDIVDTTEDGMTIHDIQKKAREFWEKVGVKYTDRHRTDGRIEKETQ